MSNAPPAFLSPNRVPVVMSRSSSLTALAAHSLNDDGHPDDQPTSTMQRSLSASTLAESPGPPTPPQLTRPLRALSKPTPLSDIPSRSPSAQSSSEISHLPLSAPIRKDASFSFDDPHAYSGHEPTAIAASRIASKDSQLHSGFRRASSEDAPSPMAQARKALLGLDLDDERRAEMEEVERVRRQREQARQSLVGVNKDQLSDEVSTDTGGGEGVGADDSRDGDAESDSDRSVFGSYEPASKKEKKRTRPQRSNSQPGR